MLYVLTKEEYEALGNILDSLHNCNRSEAIPHILEHNLLDYIQELGNIDVDYEKHENIDNIYNLLSEIAPDGVEITDGIILDVLELGSFSPKEWGNLQLDCYKAEQ